MRQEWYRQVRVSSLLRASVTTAGVWVNLLGAWLAFADVSCTFFSGHHCVGSVYALRSCLFLWKPGTFSWLWFLPSSLMFLPGQ